jgi:hypothetical protein
LYLDIKALWLAWWGRHQRKIKFFNTIVKRVNYEPNSIMGVEEIKLSLDAQDLRYYENRISLYFLNILYKYIAQAFFFEWVNAVKSNYN